MSEPAGFVGSFNTCPLGMKNKIRYVMEIEIILTEKNRVRRSFTIKESESPYFEVFEHVIKNTKVENHWWFRGSKKRAWAFVIKKLEEK
jgi:hypothetical protein